MVIIGNDWDERLAGEWDKPYYTKLRSFLAREYREGTVYPPADDIFNALRLTPYADVRAVILGQDPYHEPGQAQGLAFSVPADMVMPPSLVNILKELESDLGIRYGQEQGRESGGPSSAHWAENAVLGPWARHGVLLLNTVLTVRAHQAGSHRGHGWEQFTDRVIELLAMREQPMVFILWGANAGAKRELILKAQVSSGPERRHLIIQAPHPSPLSAYRGFFGGRYFSRTNYFLEDNGVEPVDWRL
ncbi:MAG: uracil-DNA glycosylase [Mogibacterium sp.]|nr:uracil-DNA glycosylase [Mogibacterium sp.]